MAAEKMTLDYISEDGVITLRLQASDSPAYIQTTFEDTDNGVNLRTVIVDGEGREKVAVDTTDRSTPPLELMVGTLRQYHHSFLHNAQASLNRIRYDRLKERGGMISMYDMCMDGLHRADQYKEIPFEGGIVGVPEHHENEPTDQDEQRVELDAALENELRGILGGEDAA